jgi:hypothetical protein
MKDLYLLLFTLLMATTSVLVSIPKSYAFHMEQLSPTPQYSLLKGEPVSSRPKKMDSEINYIAQDFMPIVMIANAPDHLHFFSYYLSTYNLERQKEYFLLI